MGGGWGGGQERPNTAGSLSLRLHVYRFLKAPNWWITAPCDYLHPRLRGPDRRRRLTDWLISSKAAPTLVLRLPQVQPAVTWKLAAAAATTVSHTAVCCVFFSLPRRVPRDGSSGEPFASLFASLFSFSCSSPGIALQRFEAFKTDLPVKTSLRKILFGKVSLLVRRRRRLRSEESHPSPTREVEEN